VTIAPARHVTDTTCVTFELGPVLDLHTFRPADVAELVADYLDEAVARGWPEVRIVHGKGTGTLRRIVHAALERHAAVVGFRQADANWGATIVALATAPGAP
jgi:dsDNA-specific endonuclease/ATPase MutS2